MQPNDRLKNEKRHRDDPFDWSLALNQRRQNIITMPCGYAKTKADGGAFFLFKSNSLDPKEIWTPPSAVGGILFYKKITESRRYPELCTNSDIYLSAYILYHKPL